MNNYKRIDLDNGLRVVLNHMPHMESAAVGVWVDTGSRNENTRLSGISHFIEHMVFKGTPTRNTRKIKEEIEGRGGSLNGFTSEEVTCYWAKVSAQHIDFALDVLSDIALNASMQKEAMERERTVIMEEIKMYRDLPNHYVHDILSEIMWPRNSLGLPVAGDLKSVSAIKRKDLLIYKNKNYTPGNMVLVISGNLKGRLITQKIEGLFKKSGKTKPLSIVRFVNRQRAPQMNILDKNTEQSHLSMGLHTFGKMHHDRYALGLLHIILGANMSSRLFENVREKRGLAYAIGSEVKRYKDTGAFVVNAGIEHKKVRRTVALIIKELKKIKREPVSKNELRKAKEFFRVQLLLALEDTLEHMLFLGEYTLAMNKLPDKNEIIKDVEKVSPHDLQRVAKSIFNSKSANLALIGPLEGRNKRAIKQELEELG